MPTPCSSAAGATDRRGSVDDGTSISDVEDEEKRRHFTIDCHLLHLEPDGKQIHLIDTPGYPDFIGNALSALAAVENVILTVCARPGSRSTPGGSSTRPTRLKLGQIIALTKMDADNVDYLKVLESVRETFGAAVRPVPHPGRPGARRFSGRHRRDEPAGRRPRRLPAAPRPTPTRWPSSRSSRPTTT